MRLPAIILLMAEHAFGTVSVRDLVALGFSRVQIKRWVDRGLLEVARLGELRIPGSARTPDQETRLRLNRAGRGARIAGAWVLARHGIEGFTHVTDDHIAVPRGRRVRGLDVPVVSTILPPEDHDWLDGLPAVTLARGFIGACATYSDTRIRAGLDDAKRRKLLDLCEFEERAFALGNAHGAPQARRIVRSGKLRMESEGERNLFDVFHPGDPLPQPQVWVRWKGKYFRLDFAYLEGRIDLEYHGGNHDERMEDDAERTFALAELEIQTVPITKGHMRDPEGTRRRILNIVRKRRALGLPPIVSDPPPWASQPAARLAFRR